MVAAMVYGGLRRVEVLGLRFSHVQPGDRRLFIAEGKGGAERVVPVATPFFVALRNYLDDERPREASTDAIFVVLKGQRRGERLSAAGVDQILESARERAGLAHCTCHQLRHTCFTRLREAGMALEAIQALAGHRSIETTRAYVQLGDEWVATEYLAAMERIDRDLVALGGAR
jgi:integrase